MRLSLAQARRLALSAQGFGRRPAKPTMADVRRLAKRISAFQIDSINVLVRSHYLPAFSRLGPYPMRALDSLTYERRELFECWGHAADLMPIEIYPLLRYRAAAKAGVPWPPHNRAPDARYLEAVYDQVAERGPLTARELTDAGERRGKWWGWNAGKIALEYLLDFGRVEIAGRRNFERVYDIAQRVIPRAVLDAPVPGAEDSQKELLCRAARGLGVAAGRQLAGYLGVQTHRFAVRGEKPMWPRLLAELVEDGRLAQVTVEGWRKPGYLVPGARVPRSIETRALVSPFDTIMWGTAQSCFGFTQNLAQQLYVPADKRVYGYYVLPFLLDEAFVARCDLKADRQRSVLVVRSAYLEPGHEAKPVASELGAELGRMREWLGLEHIEVESAGTLARTLRRSL